MIKELGAIAVKLNEERSVLNRILDQAYATEAVESHVTPEWSVKDAVAHLVGAERGMTRIAQRIAKGENPQLPEGYNNDEYNARQVFKRNAQTLDQVREELGDSRAELMGFLERITPEQLVLVGEHPIYGQTTLKDLLVIIYSHETMHGNEIADKIRESKK